MPTIKRLSDTLKICMYAGDHAPPHIHVLRTGKPGFTVDLVTFQVSRGTYDPRDFAEAVAWANSHREKLLRKWTDLNERD